MTRTPATARMLDGVRVLDLSRLLPGPYCSMILSDLGAEVDKLEDPHVGDYMRMFPPLTTLRRDGQSYQVSGRFAAINRSKRSLCLDLKNPLGRAALLRLLPRYQILIESFRPGVLDRLGLSMAELHAKNPALVVCSISGYGKEGPYRERAGHDLNYAALAGVLGLSAASPEASPHPLPIQLADLGAGALWAAVAILGALRVAERTGAGQHLDISMCEGALSFLIPDLGNLAASGEVPVRGADLLTGGAACYGVYETADGKFLSVGSLEPKFWLAMNAVLGRPADTSELVAAPDEQARIRAELAARLRTKTRAEWLALFKAADACVEPVLTLDELAGHPLHEARGLFFAIPVPGASGEPAAALPQVRTPVLPRERTAEQTLPPRMGEHSRQILREGGLSEDEIAALFTVGGTRE